MGMIRMGWPTGLRCCPVCGSDWRENNYGKCSLDIDLVCQRNKCDTDLSLGSDTNNEWCMGDPDSDEEDCDGGIIENWELTREIAGRDWTWSSDNPGLAFAEDGQRLEVPFTISNGKLEELMVLL